MSFRQWVILTQGFRNSDKGWEEFPPVGGGRGGRGGGGGIGNFAGGDFFKK